MSNLDVQTFLKTASLNDLKEAHGINYRLDDDQGYKFSLNYDQIEASDGDKIAQQCRGLILRTDPVAPITDFDSPLGDTVVLARPFDRFFNYGQAHAAPVDLNHPATAFFEKLDGTLCIVYFDDVKQEWHVATRGVPEANLPVDGFKHHTFRSLFEKAIKETTGKDFEVWTSENLFRNWTYMFELTTPENRIVVAYEDYTANLLGVRKKHTGEEIDPTFVNVRTPSAKRYRFGSMDELINFVNDRDPKNHEGIVVCDHKFNRVKVKNAGYLALNKVRDSAMSSPRAITELVLLDKLDDALPLLPDHIQEYGENLREAFRAFLQNQKKLYDLCYQEADTEAPVDVQSPARLREHRKVFALGVKKHGGFMPAFMRMYEGKDKDLRDFFNSRKNKQGGFANGFLDMITKEAKKHWPEDATNWYWAYKEDEHEAS